MGIKYFMHDATSGVAPELKMQRKTTDDHEGKFGRSTPRRSATSAVILARHSSLKNQEAGICSFSCGSTQGRLSSRHVDLWHSCSLEAAAVTVSMRSCASGS